MAIDLHTHSTVSDGTDSPADLMTGAAEAGLDVVALTDHDTTEGWAEAAAAVATTGVALVRGAELSTTHEGVSVHLLAYLHDPDHPPLLEALERSRRSRDGRARRMVEKIAADYPLQWEDVEAHAAPGATIGRPHIADALVTRGHVEHRTQAFEHILAGGGPYYVRYESPELTEMVRMVKDAGGVPVLAHVRASARGATITDADIASLVPHGLAGLEVDHRDHTGADRAHLRVLASELGLLITGSSDYHGTGKPNLLGENTTAPEVLAAIEEQGTMEVLRA